MPPKMWKRSQYDPEAARNQREARKAAQIRRAAAVDAFDACVFAMGEDEVEYSGRALREGHDYIPGDTDGLEGVAATPVGMAVNPKFWPGVQARRVR
jgi:hypothetical protein